MSIRERKEREKNQRQELILNAANEIITVEGVGQLSIRKIANKIEYSPSVIYHYFRDKEDIINHLMQRSYQKIIKALASAQALASEPREKIREMNRNYIDLALEMSEQYLAIMLNKSPSILEHTSILVPDAAKKRAALEILCQNIKELYPNQSVDDSLIELTAQTIWTATFGLIIRLITEKELISQEQKNKLIEHHLKIIVEKILA